MSVGRPIWPDRRTWARSARTGIALSENSRPINAPSRVRRASSNSPWVADSRTGSTFEVPNQNFSDFSFRSSVVLRWEWRRGSTLFFVLQQNRAATCSPFLDPTACPTGAAPGTAPGMGSLSDVFGIPGDNFLAVKINYWLPVR